MAAGPRVAPVTPQRWPDFERLFSGRGCPHHCWCTPYRIRGAHEMTKDGRREAMRRAVRAGTPIGVLAYDGDEPVGWCSAAPRETYPLLAGSRTMPRVDEAPTWTVLCFFVRRDHRGTGLPRKLLEGAVREARAAGAKVVEGYPWDTAGITSQHRGHSSVFRAAGFRQEDSGRRWVRRLRPSPPRPGPP